MSNISPAELEAMLIRILKKFDAMDEKAKKARLAEIEKLLEARLGPFMKRLAEQRDEVARVTAVKARERYIETRTDGLEKLFLSWGLNPTEDGEATYQ